MRQLAIEKLQETMYDVYGYLVKTPVLYALYALPSLLATPIYIHIYTGYYTFI
jgi:hypothetical protein